MSDHNFVVETALKDEILHGKPFAIRDLSVLCYANGFTLWHYKCDDPRKLLNSGFFDGAADMVSVGDLVVASGSNGGGIYVVVQAGTPVTLTEVFAQVIST